MMWARTSAEQGDATGAFNLGSHLVRGLGVPRDVCEGVKRLAESAARGDADTVALLRSLAASGEAEAAAALRRLGLGGR